jgi:flagellin
LAKATEFNGIRLLDGSSGRMEVQIGLKNDPAVDRLSFDGDKIDIRVASIGVGGTDVAHKGSAQESLGKIDTAINRVAGVRADLGAFVNRMESIINTFAVNVENLSAANSRIRDADIAAEAADLTKNNILLQAGSSVLTQANAFPKTVLNIIGATSVQ